MHNGKILSSGISGSGEIWVGESGQYYKCPYGKPGDVLWVRETWRGIEQDFGQDRYEYKSTETINKIDKWKPSIYMPKTACRLFLKVVSVKIEKLHDISSLGC